MAISIQRKWRHLVSAGGYDVSPQGKNGGQDVALWMPHALPSVIHLTNMSADLVDHKFQLPLQPELTLSNNGSDCMIDAGGFMHRVHNDVGDAEPTAVLLPFDELFEIRALAAIRLWRGLKGRSLGPNPAALTKTRQDRLILTLRALDGRLLKANYREIAEALFGAHRMPKSGWKTHDLRDRTIRLVRLGLGLMRGGYRRLLLHPYRRRP